MKVIICCGDCGNEDLELFPADSPYASYKCKKCGTVFDIKNGYSIYCENGSVSDGYHTFDELYHHRMILFATICNVYRKHAWKSWKHHDGTMYDDYFIVGVDTPEGQYSYHYHKDNWNYFNVVELPNAPKWDGHEPKDIDRLLSLNN